MEINTRRLKTSWQSSRKKQRESKTLAETKHWKEQKNWNEKNSKAGWSFPNEERAGIFVNCFDDFKGSVTKDAISNIQLLTGSSN